MGMLFAFFSVADVCGFSLEDLITPDQIAALTAGEKPIHVQFSNPKQQLIPRNDVLRRLVETMRVDFNPNIMVEILYLYKKPEEAKRGGWSAAEEARLFNEISALSTIAGLQYFSTYRNTMQTLFETSQVIDDPSTKRPLPDPVHLRPPAELTAYAQLKDTVFGNNIYQFKFYSSYETMIFTQENLTSMTFGIFPVIGKNRLRLVGTIIDAEDYLLVYAVSMIKAALPQRMRQRAGNSFSSIAEAVLHWFSAQADKAFKN